MTAKRKMTYLSAGERLDKAERTTQEARARITAESDVRNAKTARLRDLRLAKEAAEQPEPHKAKPAVKTPGKATAKAAAKTSAKAKAPAKAKLSAKAKAPAKSKASGANA